jgi:hypothetical protein
MNNLISLLSRTSSVRAFLNLGNNFNRSHRTITSSTDQNASDCGKKPASKKASTKKKAKTPKGKFDYDDFDEAPKSYSEKEPLAAHPNGLNMNMNVNFSIKNLCLIFCLGINPATGEQGGPKGD